MARMLTYSARLVKGVGIQDGHWVLVKTNNERVVADGTKFIVRINDYNVPIFLVGPENEGEPGYGLSRNNAELHDSIIRGAYPEYDTDIVGFLNQYILDVNLDRVPMSIPNIKIEVK